jgi:hypothetical protein
MYFENELLDGGLAELAQDLAVCDSVGHYSIIGASRSGLFIDAIQATQKDVASPGKTLLIETHSEHILLRRIRETTDNDLEPGVF